MTRVFCSRRLSTRSCLKPTPEATVPCHWNPDTSTCEPVKTVRPPKTVYTQACADKTKRRGVKPALIEMLRASRPELTPQKAARMTIDDLCEALKPTASHHNSVVPLNGWNPHVLGCLAKLHEEWQTGTNPFALIEASYLVDYYCSQVVIFGDPFEKSVKTAADLPAAADLERRRMRWANGMYTYEFFKSHPADYVKGLKRVKEIIADMVVDVKRSVPAPLREAMESGRWHMINVSTLFSHIQTAMTQRVHYYASVWGMYRLINMHAVDPKKKTLGDKLPCSCICKSLLFSSILLFLGYPREKVYTLLQVDKEMWKQRKKPSHWAVAVSCENLASKMKKQWNAVAKLQDLGEIGVGSSQAFVSFTRDIIYYYKVALSHYKELPWAPQKYHVLSRLIRTLDKYFLKKHNLALATKP
jgi:hypothetical protein